MNIDRYKKGDNYEDEDGIYYEDAEQFFCTKILGFCGCGNPEDALKHVYESLKLINDFNSVLEKKTPYNEWHRQVDEYFKDSGAEYFMWYFLDNKKLTEHGGSVPGWLTVKGQELLEDLNEYFKQLNKKS